MDQAEPPEALARSLSDEGFTLLEGGRFPEALATLLQALALDARNALVHYRLGLLYADTGRPADALSHFDLATRLEPHNIKAHNNRGAMLQRLDRRDEAESAYRRVISLDPLLPQPYMNLGHLLEERGANAEAAALYSSAIANGLDRELFEQHRATALALNTPASPASWVRATFDNFAPSFDRRLEELEYRVPELLARRLLPRVGTSLDILDMGCGTGMCGSALSPVKRTLVGVDLSERMLLWAGRRGVYDQLHTSEIHEFLVACPSGCFDVVVAADVFIYIGDLDRIFREVSRTLRYNGWFAFSTEEVPMSDDFLLLASGRYAQAQKYVLRLASGSFQVHAADPITVRTESGVPLPGRLYLLQRC